MPDKNGDIITECITGTVAKAADRYAMDVMGLKSLALMETASSKIAEYVTRHYPLSYKISVLCGVGNNGADGVCASRILLREGYQPHVYIVGSLEKASWEFLYQLCHFQQAGGAVTMYRPNRDTANAGGAESSSACPHGDAPAKDVLSVSSNTLPDDDILIDGIFGIGLHREIAGDYRLFIEEANRRSHGFVLAIDAPSGINTDTGALMGCGIKADVTITFGRNKTGLACGAGQNLAGRVLVEDIGIPDEAYIEAEKHL